MANAIVSEVVKHLEVLPVNLQTQVLNFVRGLTSTPQHDIRRGELPSVSEVVTRIKKMPPNWAMVTQPQGSLSDALRESPSDPEFDLYAWEQEWAAAESELKRINFENDVAEGRI